MKLTFTLLILALFVSLFKASPLIDDDDGTGRNDPLEGHGQRTKRMNQIEAIDLLRRFTREAVKESGKTRGGGCKYRKGQWSACDPQTKVRTRTFTLKKGDTTACEAIKTLQKECKAKKAGKQRTPKNRNGANGGVRGQNKQSVEQALRSSN